MKKDYEFNQNALLRNLDFFNLAPLISICASAGYLIYDIRLLLILSIAICLLLIVVIVCVLMFLLFKYGKNTVIETQLNLFQVGIASLSLFLPFYILSFKYFIL